MDLNKFHREGEYFYIPEEDWLQIKESCNKEEIKDELASILIEYPPPFPEIDELDILSEYRKLKGVWWNDVLVEGQWFPREGGSSDFDTSFNNSHYFFRRINTGNKSSNGFHIKNRWSVDHARNPSALRSWETEKGIKGALNALFTMPGLDEVSKKTLRSCLSLRKYIASQFKPSIAKSFYDKFRSKNILDFSMGWGDRLAGFYASNTGQYYVGIDPNTMNHPNYQKQVEFYEKHRTMLEVKKDTEFHQFPAEDFDYSKYTDFFDTVFTSPPYFDIERYSDDDTQSWKRYKTIDRWNKEFLHTTLQRIIPTVIDGGIIAINISDVYSWGKWQSIVEPLLQYMESEPVTYKGSIGMELAQRPNSGGAGTGKSDHFNEDTKEKTKEVKDKTFCEPIFIFEK